MKLNPRRRRNHTIKHLVVDHSVYVEVINQEMKTHSPYQIHKTMFPKCEWTVNKRRQ